MKNAIESVLRVKAKLDEACKALSFAERGFQQLVDDPYRFRLPHETKLDPPPTLADIKSSLIKAGEAIEHALNELGVEEDTQ